MVNITINSNNTTETIITIIVVADEMEEITMALEDSNSMECTTTTKIISSNISNSNSKTMGMRPKRGITQHTTVREMATEEVLVDSTGGKIKLRG